MRCRSRVVTSLAVIMLVSACAGSPAHGSDARPARLPVISCSFEVRMPSRWSLVRSVEIEGDDRIGVRIAYRAQRGVWTYLTSGVGGSIGDALPVRARVSAVGDTTARLMGMPGGSLWVLAWSGEDRCGMRSATVVGLDRQKAMQVLENAGIVV